MFAWNSQDETTAGSWKDDRKESAELVRDGGIASSMGSRSRTMSLSSVLEVGESEVKPLT